MEYNLLEQGSLKFPMHRRHELYRTNTDRFGIDRVEGADKLKEFSEVNY